MQASPVSTQTASVNTQAAAVHTQATPMNAQVSAVKTSDDAARGFESYKRGDFDAATKALRAATKKDKTDADAWYYLGLALIKQNKTKDARKAFETTLRLNPNSVPASNGLAYILITQNNLDEAMRVVQNSLKLESRNPETHCLLGTVYLRTGSYNRALAEAEESAKLDPNYSQSLLLKSESLVGMIGNEINAMTDETPDMREALSKKITSRFDEAATALEKFSRLNPNSADAASLSEQIKVMRMYGGASGATAPDGASIYPAKEVTIKAAILARPEPLYTERARQDQVTGKVQLRMVLAADGTVKYIFPITKLPDGLTEAAIKAARAIKFIPAQKDGRPVSQYATIIYNFNIY